MLQRRKLTASKAIRARSRQCDAHRRSHSCRSKLYSCQIRHVFDPELPAIAQGGCTIYNGKEETVLPPAFDDDHDFLLIGALSKPFANTSYILLYRSQYGSDTLQTLISSCNMPLPAKLQQAPDVYWDTLN